MQARLEQIFPIMEIDGDCIMSKMGEISIVFKTELPEIFSLSQQDYEILHQCWLRALKALPENSILHKQDWFFQSSYKPDLVNHDQGFLSRSSELHFNERPYLQHNCYLMLTKVPQQRKPASSLFSTLVRGGSVPKDVLQESYRQEFLDCCAQFARILEDSGMIHLRRLTQDELMSSENRAGLIERYCSLGETDEMPQISDLDFRDGLRIGEKHCQIYSLGDARHLPPMCGSRIDHAPLCTDVSRFSIGFAANLGQLLPCDHIYNQYLFLGSPPRTLQRLERKRLRLQSLARHSRENKVAWKATEQYLDEAISQHRLPLRAHFNLLVWTKEPTKLARIKRAVGASLSRMEAIAKVETVGAPQIYWAGIPGNAGDFPMNDTFDTFAEQATCMFSMESSSRSSPSPVGLRLGDRLSGRPLHVDISDEPMAKGISTNRNKFILGPSGSGKSFFTNHMLRNYHEQGSHLVLVDVGHSYRGLCQMLGGYYFTCSERQPICFNPFYLGDDQQLDTEKKESIKTLLLALWKKDDEPYRRSEYVAISNAITGYYQYLDEQDISRVDFDGFYEFFREQYLPKLRSEGVSSGEFNADNFLYVLRPYYKGGEFDYLLNATQKLDMLEQRMIVFELEEIKEHPVLFPVVTIIIMEVFMNKMRRLKGVRKVILIEEAWKALMKEGFAQYIQYLFKTVRKHFGEAVVVTQEVEDIISSPIVKQAIINNSDCKILLDQRKYQNKFEQVQQLLALTDSERSMVLSLNQDNDSKYRYKEVFISLGGTYSRVYRTEVSLEEYIVFTTEQSEQVAFQQYLKACAGDFKSAISQMARDMRSGELKQ